MRDVAIIGIGINKWGELWEKSLRDVFVESALDAVDEAGVDSIDSMYVGCMTPGLFNGQEHLGSLLADYLGVTPIPATRVESACASGGVALRSAMLEVASGMNDIVLAGGVEKMTDVGGGEATYALGTAADQNYECFQGITFPGLYAMMANAHMHKHGTTREQLAAVSVKNHRNGAKNPNAQFRREFTKEQIIDSVMVADPLRILDCSPVTDGSAAVILCPLDKAESIAQKEYVRITGSGHATDKIALSSRDSLTEMDATETASRKALEMADRSIEDIDVAEVHDCFSIAEVIVTESLGFFEKGEGGKAADDGRTALDGEIPVNPSGGLKSKGHPVGATGIGQVIEIVKQIRGEAQERQVDDVGVGLTQNMGGSGGSALVHIMEKI